jgi:calmodulin
MSKGQWEDIFMTIDEQGTGSIPVAKFGTACRAGGGYPTEEQVKTMIGKADPTGSGKIKKDAFITQMEWINSVNPLDIEEVGASFKVFDQDGNGKITKVELQHCLTGMGDKMTIEEADDFIREAKLDKDGLIDYMSFLKEVTME